MRMQTSSFLAACGAIGSCGDGRRSSWGLMAVEGILHEHLQEVFRFFKGSEVEANVCMLAGRTHVCIPS